MGLRLCANSWDIWAGSSILLLGEQALLWQATGGVKGAKQRIMTAELIVHLRMTIVNMTMIKEWTVLTRADYACCKHPLYELKYFTKSQIIEQKFDLF